VSKSKLNSELYQEFRSGNIRLLIIALVLMVLIFVAGAIMAYRQQTHMIAHREMLIERYRVAASLDRIFAQLLAAENARHDLIEAERKQYLDTVARVKAAVDASFAAIVNSRAVEPAEMKRVEALRISTQISLAKLTEFKDESAEMAALEVLRKETLELKKIQDVEIALLERQLTLSTGWSITAAGAVTAFGLIALIVGSAIVVRLFASSAKFAQLSREHALEVVEARDQMSKVLASMDEGVLLFDGDSRVTFANDKAGRLFNVACPTLVGKTFYQLFAGSTSRPLAEYLNLSSVYEGGVSLKHLELTLLRDNYGADDSEGQSVSATVSPIHTDDKITGAICSFFDTTAQRENEKRLEAQFDITRILARGQVIKETVAQIIDVICEQFNWACGEMWLVESKGELLEHKAFSGSGAQFQNFGEISRAFTFRRGECLAGEVWQLEQPVWYEDVVNLSQFSRRDAAFEANLHAAVALPIFSGQAFVGVLVFFATQVRERDDSRLAMLSSICSQLGQFIEHAQTQERLTLSEQRYSLAVAGTMDGIWEWDVVRDSVYYSKQWKALLGYAEHEFDPGDMSFLELVHPDDLAGLKNAQRAHLSGETPFYSHTFRIKHRNGEYRWFAARGMALRDDKGNPLRLAGASRDVTEEMQAKQKILESERKFRAIFDKQFGFIGLLNVDGTLIDSNKTALDAVDAKLSDVQGRYFWDCPWWSHSEHLQKLVREGIASAAAGHFVRFQADHVASTGAVMHVDFSLQPVYDEDGNVVLLIPEGRDVTELKDAQEKLRESEAMFRRLTENVKAIFWISSVDGKFDYVSPAFEQITGGKVDDVLQDASAFFKGVHKDDLANAKRLFSESEGAEVQFRILREGGDVRWISARSFPIYGDSGEVMQLCGVADDISDRKEAEKRVSEFYSTVSHELRSPLTSIRGSLGLIEGGLLGEVGEEVSTFVTIARVESDRLIRLINSILDLRKIEAGKLELRIQQIAVDEIIKNAMASMSGMAHESEVTLTCAETLADVIEVDADRVQQVLSNLISNGIKFSPANSSVTLKASSDGEFVHFTVEDQGQGIEADDMPKLFGKFQQLDSTDSRSHGGTGLGLAISKALVEQHGGAIGVASKAGKGCKFWFTLPRKAKFKNDRPVTLA
jgi:PAS domain S-box-containing protein